ncbi:hypothetical protein [Psychrobacter sp. M13]|uniref:hypothetical protein n=1 Tax=Psychrobacter sp. M13 TaxID=3067275 RepID=UPI00273B5918|nr:hypothetical protein [Psychrobacter sp. M13]WLP94033.1 hypothetical protein Q9G97_10640 [Psychrobacter sp. M13]
MSQRFKLQLAMDGLSIAARQLSISVEQLHLIQVMVDISLIQPSTLALTYQIRLPNRRLASLFDWPQWQPDQVKFIDYLWEQTCLECFITGANPSSDIDQTTHYIEINASPNGRYALYQFADYRQPDCMPPVPLYKANSDEQASINWIAHLPLNRFLNTSSLNVAHRATSTPNSLSALMFTAVYDYKRSFTIDLDQLPRSLLAKGIEQLHPCVILYFDSVALYFAAKHASPPDFHQKHYWTNFKP